MRDHKGGLSIVKTEVPLTRTGLRLLPLFFCVEKNPSPLQKKRRKQTCFAPRTCWPVSNLQYCMLDAAGLLVNLFYLCDASLPVGQSLLSVLSLHFVLASVCCLGLHFRGISLMRTHPDSQRRNSHYVPLTSCLSCCFPSFHLIAKKNALVIKSVAGWWWRNKKKLQIAPAWSRVPQQIAFW